VTTDDGKRQSYRERLRTNLKNPLNRQMLQFALMGNIVCVCVAPLLIAGAYCLRAIHGFSSDAADELFSRTLVLFGGLAILGIISVLALSWMLRMAKEDATT
jgi:hypothetical protein